MLISHRLILVSCLAFGATALAASPARAGEFDLHAEQDFGFITNGNASAFNSHSYGFGFSGRLGYRIGLGPVFLAPEGGAGYITFGDLHPARIFGGARFGLGGIVQPQIYGHAGYGWMGGGDFANTVQGYQGRGVTFDGGFALEFVLLKLVSIGGHVGYTTNQGGGDLNANWVNTGLSFGILL